MAQGRVELGVIGIIGYSTLPRSPELEAQHQMKFSVINTPLKEVLTQPTQGTVSLFQ